MIKLIFNFLFNIDNVEYKINNVSNVELVNNVDNVELIINR